MKIPISWLKDFIDINLPLEDLAHLLTMAGLEVEEIRLVGFPMPTLERREFKYSGLSWDPDKIVVGQINEVMPHPNADRLVLCRLDDGQREHIVLTGAPNLFPYKGKGNLQTPLKVAYAKEGAQIYDGHQPGNVLTKIKRTKIRGVESSSMACSEKELGISDEHEGVIIMDEDAFTGQPLVNYMGDAVMELDILTNMIRNASLLGVAREIAAFTGQSLKKPTRNLPMNGKEIAGQASIHITDPELNPRFVLGLVRNVTPQPSPYWVQRRLRLAGMRPINSIVDATNYVMLVTGEPLHAFDYDVLVERAGGKAPTIITRAAEKGERLTTLDDVEHTLDSFTIVVADTAGSLSLAGVMGGLESEVTETTRNVLLEGATWNPINVRRTVSAHRLVSEAGYRFSRGIHPALASTAVELGLDCIAQWSEGEIAAGLVDEYPIPLNGPVVSLTPHTVHRLLGIELSAKEISELLFRLEFECRIEGKTVHAKVPPHRLDIGEGVIGQADMIEEIARLYGYDNIPTTRLADTLPLQRNNPSLEKEKSLRDTLVNLGIQETVNYYLTSPERGERVLPSREQSEDILYVRLQNPISQDRIVMRRSLLTSLLEALERNIRLRKRLALFEIGPVFLPQEGQDLPEEPRRLAIVLTGLRHLPTWDQPSTEISDFYDLKGLVEAMLEAVHIKNASFDSIKHPSYHPGKCARLILDDKQLGILGELHPMVKEQYDFGEAPVLAAEFDLEVLLAAIPTRHEVQPVPVFPPVLEDIAVIVDEDLPAAQIVEVIRKAGGKLLTEVQLFDTYRSKQIGDGKKSLAYNLTYQAPDRTLNDKEATKIRQRIIRLLDKELGAKLRS